MNFLVHEKEENHAGENSFQLLAQFPGLKSSPPMVGEWFYIYPQDIDWEKIELQCKDSKDSINLWEDLEWAKQQISEDAKYQGLIRTLIPKKTWRFAKKHQLKQMAKSLGYELSDEVVTNLELAQRMQNGERASTLTDKEDHIQVSRLIILMRSDLNKMCPVGDFTSVGGSGYPPSYISREYYSPNRLLFYHVPAIVDFLRH